MCCALEVGLERVYPRRRTCHGQKSIDCMAQKVDLRLNHYDMLFGGPAASSRLSTSVDQPEGLLAGILSEPVRFQSQNTGSKLWQTLRRKREPLRRM
ncbi:unnamed protein product [Protopolystoma xenopodis]|uniref:Uncharacterized protein n=1 Tax=Protopolystoma xenopodis TaxID=117903 RepID=A0A3S5CC38_9PLAT|nr:unnamed protein product [Protopolystoma xenopodis]